MTHCKSATSLFSASSTSGAFLRPERLEMPAATFRATATKAGMLAAISNPDMVRLYDFPPSK